MRENTVSNHLVSFWLVPEPECHARLGRIIDRLAYEFDAPPFEPHVTLHVALGRSKDVEEALPRIASSFAPFDLVATETSHGEDRFKSVFIEFETSPRPFALHEALRDAMAEPAGYILHPHLSLIYKILPEPTRRELVLRNALRGERIVFDHLAAVRPKRGEDSWDNVLGLDVWLRAPLSG